MSIETPNDGLATWSVMDCHLGAFRAKAGAGVDVVVTGTLAPSRYPDSGDALLSSAEACVVGTARP